MTAPIPPYRAVDVTELVRVLGAGCSPMGGPQGYIIGPDVTGRLCHCATCSSLGAAQRLAQSLNDVWSQT